MRTFTIVMSGPSALSVLGFSPEVHSKPMRACPIYLRVSARGVPPRVPPPPDDIHRIVASSYNKNVLLNEKKTGGPRIHLFEFFRLLSLALLKKCIPNGCARVQPVG